MDQENSTDKTESSMYDIPKPTFIESAANQMEIGGEKKEKISLPAPELLPPLPTHQENIKKIASPVQSFCESNGLSELAFRCGAISNPLTSKEIDILDSIDHSSITNTNHSTLPVHPYANQYNPNSVLEPPHTNHTEDSHEEYTPPGPSPKSKSSKRKTPISKKKKDDKSAKPPRGLRDFSYLVMSKVEQKRNTTYTQVSDELVHEILGGKGTGRQAQNIKRRVYDALNVLRALHIISKDKKTISWVGLPQHSAQALEKLKKQKEEIKLHITQKKERWGELQKQLRAYQMVAARNTFNTMIPDDKKIVVPFFLASSPSGSKIDCEMSENRAEYCISFEKPFNLYTESQLLEMIDLNPPNEEFEQTTLISPSSLSNPSFLQDK